MKKGFTKSFVICSGNPSIHLWSHSIFEFGLIRMRSYRVFNSKLFAERNKLMGDSKMEESVESEVLTPIATTSSLEALQSSEQRELMDLVGRLRRAGLSTLLQLPQIVVCGDQSSGKSSVLEAITEIPFPRKENLCTRFATEISLRRDMVESISCKINPDETRSDDEINRLRDFSGSIRNFDELPSLIDAATEAMGLGPSKAFSRDVLCIEICGPDRPQLYVHTHHRTFYDYVADLTAH